MRRRLLHLLLFATFAAQFFAQAHAQTYTTSGNQIQSNGTNWCGGGVNAFDQFGPANTSGHGIKVVREVVNNFSSCIMGSGTQSWNGSVLHGLQDVVNNNRAQGEITILCVFGWDTSGAITGGDPSNSSSYPWFSNGQYASQLAAMANQFKGQSDVWIDPWNEPNFSSQSDWNSCVTTMYNAIRNTGNTNIILIPSNSWDSDESDYINGTGWRSGKSNVVGTIHIYSGWDWDSAANIQNRLQNILNAGWPVLVGEIGPDSYQSDPIRGIQATIAAHVPTLAWSWNSSDGDQLQNGGTLTNWGNEWFGYIGQYVPASGSAEAPYGGTRWAIPGTIQAENYDTGGEGVAYHDADSANQGGAYRTDGVDIEACSDTGGGYDIGWTNSGEWLKFMVNVTSAGQYTVACRAASGLSGGTFHIADENGNNLTGTVTVPATGGWQNWTTVNATISSLSAGSHTLKLVEDSASYNINSLKFTKLGIPHGGTAWAVPGTIQAENYDDGGAGVGYHDSDAGNTGGAYRSDDVDIQTCTDTGGGDNIGWTVAGEWLDFTINAAASGSYTASFRVASGASGGTLHLEDENGNNLTGTVTVPGTGGWQNWTTVNATISNLSAGTHTLKLVEDSAGYNINYVAFAH